MNQTSKTPLYVPPVSISTDDPAFHGDLFNRENLAKRLTDCIDRLPSGGVIAIDAPWGEGKSWFGQHWHNKLKADGYRTAFINAFERDYVEEPFVMLVSELMDGLNISEKSKLKASGVAVAKALAPLAAKSAINALAQLVTGTTNLSEKIDDQLEKAGHAIAAGAEKLLSKQIEDYEKSKVAVAGFRKTLGELAAAEDKPIVIFVDELDRCKPEFAVKLIERINHFFEMPKVVFVLLLNRDQLCKAIKGVYGGEIDADRYLSKFIHLILALPKSHEMPHTGRSANVVYCQDVMKRFGLSHLDFAEDMGAWANLSGMSLRDVERSVGLLSLSQIDNENAVWLCWPIVLKVTQPAIFAGVLKKERLANQSCIEMIERYERVRSGGKYIELFTDAWKNLHSVHARGDDQDHVMKMNEFAAKKFTNFRRSSAENLLSYFFGAVDIFTK